jgi:hypothetical protein
MDAPGGSAGHDEDGGLPLFHVVTMLATHDDVERISMNGRDNRTGGAWARHQTLAQ